MAYRIDTPEARKRLKPRREPYWTTVAKYKRLGFRRTADGGYWHAWLRPPGSSGDRERLGSVDKLDYETALKKALDWFDDTAGPEPSEIKIKHVIGSYLTFLYEERTASTYSTCRGRAINYILPHLGELRVSDLTAERLEQWMKKIAGKHSDPEGKRKGMYAANKCLVILKAALNRAHAKNRDLPAEEWRVVKPFKAGKPVSRKVFLSNAESQRLVNCCDPEFRDLVTFGLLTGARLGEVYQMRVRDFDQPHGDWDVAISKTGSRTTTLTAAAIELLERVTAGKPKSELVFTRDDGRPWDKDSVQPFMRRAVKRAELDKVTTYYSLRHSHISAALMGENVQPQVIAENCGTSLRMLEQHYAKFMRADRRAMLERGQIKLEVPEPSGKLIAIR